MNKKYKSPVAWTNYVCASSTAHSKQTILTPPEIIYDIRGQERLTAEAVYEKLCTCSYCQLFDTPYSYLRKLYF